MHKRIEDRVRLMILDDLELTPFSAAEIAEEFGIHVSTVHRIGNEAGVNMRKRGLGWRKVRLAGDLITMARDLNSEGYRLLDEARAK